MLSINLVIIFHFTLCLVFLSLTDEIDQIFVKFDVHTTCRGNFVFNSLFVFCPGWRVGFTILNWRKTDKKWPKSEIQKFSCQSINKKNCNKSKYLCAISRSSFVKTFASDVIPATLQAISLKNKSTINITYKWSNLPLSFKKVQTFLI
jgi:hypothetical protein